MSVHKMWITFSIFSKKSGTTAVLRVVHSSCAQPVRKARRAAAGVF